MYSVYIDSSWSIWYFTLLKSSNTRLASDIVASEPKKCFHLSAGNL